MSNEPQKTTAEDKNKTAPAEAAKTDQKTDKKSEPYKGNNPGGAESKKHKSA